MTIINSYVLENKFCYGDMTDGAKQELTEAVAMSVYSAWVVGVLKSYIKKLIVCALD